MRRWTFVEIAFTHWRPKAASSAVSKPTVCDRLVLTANACRTAIVYMLILLGIGFAWREMEVLAYGYSQESIVDAYAAIFITDTIMRRLLNR